MDMIEVFKTNVNSKQLANRLLKRLIQISPRAGLILTLMIATGYFVRKPPAARLKWQRSFKLRKAIM